MADETAAAPGALVLDWALTLDTATLPAGLSVERLVSGSGWVLLSPEQVAVGLEPSDGGISSGGGGPPSLLVLARNGWLRGTSYRVRLSGDLNDQLGRRFARTESLEWRVPEAPAAVTFDKKIPARFESWEAAKDDLGGRFPGGQTALFQGLWTDPVTGVAYARARWYDARNAGWLSEDPLLDIDGPNLYAFARWNPATLRDPLGTQTSADRELAVIMDRIQAAADEGARRHGLRSIADVEAGGSQGTAVHKTMQELLSPGGRFHHPRILTEVEVSQSGTISGFGTKGFAASNSLVKDIIVLQRGKAAADIATRRMLASDVTQLAIDLKIGRTGAALHQTETLARLGVKSLVLRPHEDLALQYRHVLDDLSLLRKAGRLTRYLPGLVTLLTAVVTAQEAKALADQGDLEGAIAKMTGVDVFQDLAVAGGEKLEDLARNPAVMREKANQERTKRIMDAIDAGKTRGRTPLTIKTTRSDRGAL